MQGTICSVLSCWSSVEPVENLLTRAWNCPKQTHIKMFHFNWIIIQEPEIFVFVRELSTVPRFKTTSGIEGHNTFTQTQHLFSQTPESGGAACSAPFKLTIYSSTALSPQDHWSIPPLRMEPYWPRQLARLHSRLSICLINAIYLNYADWSMSTKADLREVW